MKIKAKIDIPRYGREGEVLPELSVREGKEYQVVKQLSPSMFVIRNEFNHREIILVPFEGRLIK